MTCKNAADCNDCNDCENPYIPKECKVLEFYRETEDTFSLKVDFPSKHAPGQFVQVTIPSIGEAPISLASSSEEYIVLSIHEVGTVTNALAKLREGDPIWIRGPYGNGYPMEDLKGNDLLIIGGGCGVAPLKGIIDYVEKHRDDYGEVQLVLGYRSPTNILYERELEDWRNKYHLEVTVDKAEPGELESCYAGRTGFVTDVLKGMEISIDNKVVFICGPPVMMNFTIKILQDKGFKDEQIFISAERLMYCGIGVCCHCMIKGKYTCVDGPVFRYDEIKEDLDE